MYFVSTRFECSLVYPSPSDPSNQTPSKPSEVLDRLIDSPDREKFDLAVRDLYLNGEIRL